VVITTLINKLDFQWKKYTNHNYSLIIWDKNAISNAFWLRFSPLLAAGFDTLI